MDNTIYLRWNRDEDDNIDILVDEPVADELLKYIKSKGYKARRRKALPPSELLSKPALISIKFNDKDEKAQAMIDKWAEKNT